MTKSSASTTSSTHHRYPSTEPSPFHAIMPAKNKHPPSPTCRPHAPSGSQAPESIHEVQRRVGLAAGRWVEVGCSHCLAGRGEGGGV